MCTARRPQKKTQRFLTSLSALALTAWLCGCAGVSANGTWQDGAPRNQTYSRLLVIGVTPDRDMRCNFESSFASQLRSASTTVILSCDQIGAKDSLTRESVERAVAAVHADAVLATRLVSMKTGQQVGGTTDTRGDSLYKATDAGFGAYGMPVYYVDLKTAPPLTSDTMSLHVLTQVYETHGATLIYTVDTIAKKQEIDSTSANLMAITAPAAESLRRAGLIR